jgi:gamma-glutamylcyclotransferase (GGCT)/AIG2-like uncharacterized protein YtfP
VSDHDRTVHLFSYGTLRDPAVQVARFGRLLNGCADVLPGFREQLVEITDPEVLRLSGLRHHPIVTASGDAADQVAGTVFAITPAELAAADEYEVDDYRRIRVPLRSGLDAWVYVSAVARPCRPLYPGRRTD